MIAEAATIDILYVAFNRLEMTKASFDALRDHTPWEQVKNLYVVDDGSEDGTAEWLHEEQMQWMHKIRPQYGTDFILWAGHVGGPVAAINWYMRNSEGAVDSFAKIDNDFVVCPGWLDVSLRLHYLNPDIDILGFEPMSGHPQNVTETNHAEWRLNEARHIGGKGIIRKRAFERSGCLPYAHGERGYQGFTQWQRKHDVVKKAWISPDLCCFGLDQLPFDPWRALTTEYVENGWQRRWGEYDSLDDTYWRWWVDQDPAGIAA